MLCLGIESSCDDTGLALVNDNKIISSLLASQADCHAIFGGVVPELASREHNRWLGPLLDALLTEAGLALADIEAIAVARGPGLLGSLLSGIAFAKGLALSLDLPLIGVNHLHAHLLAAGLGQDLIFPGLGLVISGGHTELYRMESPSEFKRLGRSLDDAAGEAFDKIGKAIGLSYPAGKIIDELAQAGDPSVHKLPLAYTHNENLDFSFSGLKTAALKLAAEIGLLEDNCKARKDFCAALNSAIADTLCLKLERGLEAQPDIKAIYVAGGVAANSLVRSKIQALAKSRQIRLLMPDLPLCMDNGAMIAFAGALLRQAGYSHGLDLEATPRGRPIPDDMLSRAFGFYI